jgi:hypothetical protein
MASGSSRLCDYIRTNMMGRWASFEQPQSSSDTSDCEGMSKTQNRCLIQTFLARYSLRINGDLRQAPYGSEGGGLIAAVEGMRGRLPWSDGS